MKYRHIHKHITEIKMAIAHLQDELYSLNSSLHNIDEMLLDAQEEEIDQELEKVLASVSFEMKNIA